MLLEKVIAVYLAKELGVTPEDLTRYLHLDESEEETPQVETVQGGMLPHDEEWFEEMGFK